MHIAQTCISEFIPVGGSGGRKSIAPCGAVPVACRIVPMDALTARESKIQILKTRKEQKTVVACIISS